MGFICVTMGFICVTMGFIPKVPEMTSNSAVIEMSKHLKMPLRLASGEV